MAALLKKRALAEFSQVIQEEPKPIKKLRLIQRPAQPDIQLSLQAAISSHDALQQLLKFEQNLPVDAELLGNAVRELLDHFRREKEAVVRANVASLLGKISKQPGVNCESLADDILPLLKSEASNKVISQLIAALTIVGKSASGEKQLHKSLVDLAKQHLTNSSHLVRSNCLDLIGSLESPYQSPEGAGQSKAPTETQKLLEDFMQDQDSRVRSSAFEAMLELHQRGMQLGMGGYKPACDALTDQYEGVRMAALKLIWVLSHIFPDSMVSVPDSDEEIRLIDDGFAKICNMVNDNTTRVRVEAVRLLGSLHQVSPHFLEQTLNKRLMSDLRRKRSAHERAKQQFQSGEWSSGQKWADDAPKEELDPDNISLVSIGACGAFVHGLEDEFSEVRNSSLDSLCELASQSGNFACLSQDSIIDMFNDEIESVRLNAINSLRKLSQYLEIREDQLDIILGVLQDFSHTSRESLREMLCEMKLATKECLNTCVMALLDNLRRYPQDRLSVWKCMQYLGKNHPNLALPLIPDFLCLHPYFDTPEPEMDDPAYISIMVLVFNAAAGNRTALPMFQEHIWRQYSYLRDSIPNMVPLLQTEEKLTYSSRETTKESSTDTVKFLNQRVQQLENISSLDTATAQKLIETSVRDLQRLTELDPRVSASAECVCMFLQSQLLITQLMSHHNNIITGSVTVNNLCSMIDKILSLTNRLQTQYLGLGNNELALVRQTELKALTFRLGTTLATAQELATQMKAQDAYVTYLSDLHKTLTASDISMDSFTSYLISELATIKSTKLSAAQKTLHSALRLVKPTVCPLANRIRKAMAVIHEPTEDWKLEDNPIKFIAGLTVAVAFDAEIENVENTASIRLQVKYPDMSSELVVPAPKDIRKLSPLRHRLVTELILSHSLWSESCKIEIGIVMLSGAVQCKLKSTSSPAEPKQNVVELCKPVKVLLAPKPIKR